MRGIRHILAAALIAALCFFLSSCSKSEDRLAAEKQFRKYNRERVDPVDIDAISVRSQQLEDSMQENSRAAREEAWSEALEGDLTETGGQVSGEDLDWLDLSNAPDHTVDTLEEAESPLLLILACAAGFIAVGILSFAAAVAWRRRRKK